MTRWWSGGNTNRRSHPTKSPVCRRLEQRYCKRKTSLCDGSNERHQATIPGTFPCEVLLTRKTQCFSVLVKGTRINEKDFTVLPRPHSCWWHLPAWTGSWFLLRDGALPNNNAFGFEAPYSAFVLAPVQSSRPPQ